MFVIIISLLFSSSVFSQKNIETREDLGKFFFKFNVAGSFLLYNLNEDLYTCYDLKRCRERFLPASTFKIFNSLAGIETGIISDSNFIFYWDSTKSWNNNWNQDLILRQAFQYSCVTCYQALARKIGLKRMKYYIHREHYGNELLSGSIDYFWLNATLKISQFEQINFLKKLYKEELGFSHKAIELVKYIMLVENTKSYKLRAKTGWGNQGSLNIGWYVGYLEKDNNIFFFATNIQSKEPKKNFGEARIIITREILRSLNLL